MASDTEPRVLAIASHVTYGYVGNKMVTFVLQALGCDVSAINTVNFSNHTGYRRFTGRKTPASEIAELFAGLTAARLDEFDILLSGYTGSPEAVEAVGKISQDLRRRAQSRPGGFFWVLDPVMGDNGALYVDPAIPPVYRSLLPHADLVLPNAFEAEVLAGHPIKDSSSLVAALATLHGERGVPHVVVTSVRVPSAGNGDMTEDSSLAVVGSSATSTGAPRPFLIRVPRLPVFFSGTGDLFAALLAVRLRQASTAAGLLEKASWRPADSMAAAETPLAKAALRTLASMHAVLEGTASGVAEAEQLEATRLSIVGDTAGGENGMDEQTASYLRHTKACEVRVVRYAQALRDPESLNVTFKVEGLEVLS